MTLTPKLSIAQKIGAGYLGMVLLLLASGAVGYFAVHKFSLALGLITGPVQQTTGAINKGIRGVQTQLIAVDELLRNDNEQNRRKLASGQALMRSAMQDISSAGLVAEKRLAGLGNSMQAFNQVRNNLLQLKKCFREQHQQMEELVAHTKDLLISAEEIASQALVNAEWNINRTEEDTTDVRDSEEWDIVSATTEARLALLSRLFNLEALIKTPGDATLLEQAQNNYNDLELYLEQIAESKLLGERKVGKGFFAKSTYAEAVKAVLADNRRLFDTLLKSDSKLQQARAAYSGAANALMVLAQDIEKDTHASIASQLDGLNARAASAQWSTIVMAVVGLLFAVAACA